MNRFKLNMTNQSKFILALFSVFILSGCIPDRDNDIFLVAPGENPQFSIEVIPGETNKYVIKDLSSNNFQRLWDIKGGTPNISSKLVDTITYNKAGTYQLTLMVSKSNGSGTLFSSKTVIIEKDAPLSCSPKIALLTGNCLPEGKCWTLVPDAGAVKVGPTYDDFSWFTSTAGSLQPEQYDDRFCFTFENLVFQNKNNGGTVNPWDGYKVAALDPGISDFVFSEGTGINNRDQIFLQDNQFMGVWDADNILDIITLTESKLVVRTRLRAQNGTPNAEGWFELTFRKQ